MSRLQSSALTSPIRRPASPANAVAANHVGPMFFEAVPLYDDVYTKDDYRLVTTHSFRSAGDVTSPPPSPGNIGGGSSPCPQTVVGVSTTAYDSTLRAPTHTCQLRNLTETPTPGSAVCARVDVDLATGLTVREQSSQGFFDDTDAGLDWETGVTTTTYDSAALYPVQVENALGHTVTMTTDLGTGVGLSSHGPNPHQGSYQEIDGFGRTLHEWISIKNDPDPNVPYHYRRKRDVTYDDDGSEHGGVPTVVERPTRLLSTEGALLSNSNSQWAEIATSFDGAGRVIKVFEAALSGPVEVPSTKEYVYDASGNLVSATMPDPSLSKYATGNVAATFHYDSLNRKTCSVAPDGSGVATIHAGRTVKTFEFGSDRGGCSDPTASGVISPRGATIATTDIHGRVTTVLERIDAVADTWSTTNYEYDGNSNLAKITREDPANGDIVTEMFHDFLGQRLRVLRHGREWSYTYDDNGKMLTQLSPYPAGTQDPTEYSISVEYDDLGRPLSRWVGDGSLDPTEQTQLAIGLTTFDYDDGPLYSIGQLVRKTTPLEVVEFTYGARGNPAKTTRTIDLGAAGIGSPSSRYLDSAKQELERVQPASHGC